MPYRSKRVKDYLNHNVIWLFNANGERISMYPIEKYHNCTVLDNISTGNVLKLLIDDSGVKHERQS